MPQHSLRRPQLGVDARRVLRAEAYVQVGARASAGLGCTCALTAANSAAEGAPPAAPVSSSLARRALRDEHTCAWQLPPATASHSAAWSSTHAQAVPWPNSCLQGHPPERLDLILHIVNHHRHLHAAAAPQCMRWACSAESSAPERASQQSNRGAQRVQRGVPGASAPDSQTSNNSSSVDAPPAQEAQALALPPAPAPAPGPTPCASAPSTRAAPHPAP